jgi:hypothetical protein
MGVDKCQPPMIKYKQQQTEREKMTVQDKTYAVGDLFTTLNSGVTGVIKEINNHQSGVTRVLLETENGERWTSVYATN